MKKLISILLFIALVSFVNAQEASKFAIQSGYVKYNLTGSTVGVREIWWSDYGNKSYTIENFTSTTKIFGISEVEKVNKHTIVNDDYYWEADYITNTGIKEKNTYYDSDIEPDKELSEIEQQKQAQEIVEAFGGEKLSDEKVMGYTCEVYTLLGSKVWFYRGIYLKMEISLLGIKTEEVVTVFEPNTTISNSKFTPPSDITYSENSDLEYTEPAEVVPVENTPEPPVEVVSTEPIEYSYTKFEDALNNFSYGKYKKIAIKTQGNEYLGIYNSGVFKTLTIYARSEESSSAYKNRLGFLGFTHNGKQCYYGKNVEAANSSLVIEYPEYNMAIVIVAMPFMVKSKMIEILDALSF